MCPETAKLQALKDSLPPPSFRAMIALILPEFEKNMSAMEHAAVLPDYRELHRAAHSIKGMMANFGLDDIGDAAGQVEDSALKATEGSQDDIDGLVGLIADLRRKEPGLRTTLERLSG